ncbi:Phosphatidylinositol phosphatase PTPRQ-like isoform X5 [Oopsacas minuta]|uniref:Delta-like protein n=1 Tax=Oopsacas minuta TaxID=111878 RepID=A0AAV7K2R2_9METZ|nr:Phosphatidylinositol phosphatase PTPRQ-like isoform X5 [Oopsacas minuta]
MYKYIERYVYACICCQKNQPSLKAPTNPLNPLSIITKVWYRVGMDFTGPLIESNGYKYILSIIDHFTKWIETRHFILKKLKRSPKEISMKLTILFACCLILSAFYLKGTTGTGKLTINYIDFNTKGRDVNGAYCDHCLFCYNPCDPFFKICLRYGHSTYTFACNSGSTTPPEIITDYYTDLDFVEFGTTLGEVTNPVEYSTENSFDGNFEISIVAIDADGFWNGGDDDIDHVNIRISATKQATLGSTLTYEGLRASFVATTSLQYKFTCDEDYYSTYCTVYCIAEDSTSGHYTCNSVTGGKICNTGFSGTDCDVGSCSEGYEWNVADHSCVDVNECTLNTDQCTQICKNTVGSYECSCMINYYLVTYIACSIVTFDTLMAGSALTSRSIHINWLTTFIPNTHSVSLYYVVYYRDITFSTPSYIDYRNTTALNYNITRLLPYRNYQLYVRSIGSLSSGESNTVIVRTNQDIPSQSPTIVTVLTISDTEISLSWIAPDRESQNGIIVDYVILINVTEHIVSASSTFSVITNLNPFTVYTFSVAASTSVGKGPYSSSTTITTHESTPTSPPLLSVTTITHTTITLTLRPPNDTYSLNGIITYYTVTYTGISVDTSTRTVRVTPYTTNYLSPVDETLIGLQEGVFYNIQAAVSTSVGSGPNTDVITTTTYEIAPADTPQNIQFTTILNTSLSISWDSPPLSEQNGIITGYRLAYRGVSIDTEWINITLPTTSATLENLSEGSEYVIYICAANSMGVGPCISATETTLEILPDGAPTMFIVENRDSTSLSFSWTLPLIGERNGVIIAFYLVATDLQTNVEISQAEVSGTTFFYQFTGLEEHHNYSILIQARNSIGYGPNDKLIVLTAESSPGEAPDNFTGIPATVSITLSWLAISVDQQNGELTYYEITYFNEATFLSHTHVSTNISASELQCTIYGLEEDVVYHFRIRVYTSVGSGPYSNVISVRTEEALPSSPPTDFKAYVLSTTQIHVEYDYPLLINQNGAITGFDISVASSTESIEQIISTFLTSYTLQSLHPYTSYSIQIRAINSIGHSPYTPVIIITTNQALPAEAPTQLTLLLITHNSVNLSWDQIPSSSLNGEFVSYSVLVTATQTTNYFLYASISPHAIIPSLTPYTEYSLAVAVINTHGTGPYSFSDVTFTTLQSPPSQGPELLPIQSITNTSALVQFNSLPIHLQNGPIISYTLSIYTSADNLLVTSITLSSLSHKLSTLLPYREYTVQVTASNIAGTSSPTSTSFITAEYVPTGPPTSISATPYSAYVTLLYQPPEASVQNGIIINYSIKFGTSISTTTYTTHLTEYSVYDLEEYTQYQYSIAAWTSVGIGPFSSVLYETTLPFPPSAAPQNVTGTPESYLSIFVSWYPIPVIHQNSLVINYIVYYQGQEHDKSEGKQSVDDFKTDTIITLLKPDEVYSIIVAAENSGGIGPLSVPIYVRTLQGLPTAAPTQVIVVATSSSSYIASWVGILAQHHNGLLLAYEIVSQGANYDTSPLRIKTGLNTTSLEVTGLHPAVEYTVYVFALNAIGNGPASDSASLLLPESIPNVAPSIIDSSSGKNWIFVVWEEIDGIHRNGLILLYELRFTPSSDTQFVFINISTPTVNSNLTGLSIDTYYTIEIRAYTSAGPGPFSSEQFLSTDNHVCRVCVNGECSQGYAESICQCNPGFTGQTCDINIDDCLDVNCDHGSCTDGVNKYICECDDGYQGQLCDITTGTPVCGEVLYLNFLWLDTAYSDTVVLPCSDSDSLLFGDASRSCSADGSWLPPDVNNCMKKVYDDLDIEGDLILSPEDVIDSVANLQNIFCVVDSGSGPTFFPSEIEILIEVIVNVLDSVDSQNESTRVDLLPQVTPGVLCMLSGILDSRNLELFYLSTDSSLAIEIYELIERIAKLNAENYDTNPDYALFSEENIHMYITPLTDGKSVTLPDYDMSAVKDTGLYPNSISIPGSEVSSLFSNSHGEVPVIAVVFSRYLGQAIGSSSLNPDLDTTSTISTGVISVQNSLGEPLTFSSPITLTLKLLTSTESKLKYTCVYWDNTTHTWTSSGLRYAGESSEYFSCSSTHATSFSVLSSKYEGPNYQIIIITGSISTILCLLVIFVSCTIWFLYNYFKRKDYKFIHLRKQPETVGHPLQPDDASFNPLYDHNTDKLGMKYQTEQEKSNNYSIIDIELHEDRQYAEAKSEPSLNPFTEYINSDNKEVDEPLRSGLNPFRRDSDNITKISMIVSEPGSSVHSELMEMKHSDDT